MPYIYKEIRDDILCHANVKTLIATRDKVFKILDQSGVITMQKAIEVIGHGDSWTNMAIIEYLVELNDLEEIGNSTWSRTSQHRLFKRKN